MNFWIELDKQITLFLNSLHSAYTDNLFYILTNIKWWTPLFVWWLMIFYKNTNSATSLLRFLLTTAFLILLTDRISSGFFKPFFQRLRPCNDPEIGKAIHIINGYCSQAFSFVSSHATNSFGIAVWIALHKKFFSKKIVISAFLWSLFFSYTRIYLGVHFLGDLLGGFLLGTTIAVVLFFLLQKTGLSLTEKPRIKRHWF